MKHALKITKWERLLRVYMQQIVVVAIKSHKSKKKNALLLKTEAVRHYKWRFKLIGLPLNKIKLYGIKVL